MTSGINLRGLLPDFGAIEGIPNSAEELSAYFIAFLIAVAIGFLFWSIHIFRLSSRRIKGLMNVVQDETPASVLSSRQNLLDQADKTGGVAGHLWKEFDETLVESTLNGKPCLQNVYSAADFFNDATLASEITDSRMLAAVPGFLTAIGVIGTFAGLQLGLSELNIGGAVPVNEMKEGLAKVIGGASTAFITSVWGVTLSVVFNFIEKALEQRIRRNVKALQHHIDRVFPRFSAEQYYQQIAEDGSQSRQTLQGLAEKIGQKMQESITQVTSGIQDSLEESLNKIMAPAINRLVNETSDGSQKALEHLISRFLEKFGAEGKQQKEALAQTTSGLEASISSFKDSLATHVRQLKESQTASNDRDNRLSKTIEEYVTQLSASGKQQIEGIVAVVSEQAKKLHDANVEHSRSQAEANSELMKRFEYLNGRMAEKVNLILGEVQRNQEAHSQKQQDREDRLAVENKKLLEYLQTMTEEDLKKRTAANEEALRMQAQHQDELQLKFEQKLAILDVRFKNFVNESTHVIDKWSQLQNAFDQSVDAMNSVGTNLNSSAKELKKSATSIEAFGSGIRESLAGFEKSVGEARNGIQQLIIENDSAGKVIKSVQEGISNTVTELGTVVSRLQDTIDRASRTFSDMENHQQVYLKGLQENVESLARQMTKLLKEYSEQANQQTRIHLGEWAKHTTLYSEKMNNAAQVLSNVVDEIETKMNSSQRR